MKAQQQKYSFVKTVDASFDEAVQKTREALKNEGFGVLSEIRIDEKLKDKLGVDFRRYIILGACNPPYAYKTLQEELNIGLLLPCNVVVYDSDEPGKSVVAAIDAKTMLSVVGDRPSLKEVAAEVNEKLQLAIEQV